MNVKIENTKTIPLISQLENERIFCENLLNKLLYACEKCDESLVQLAACADCKRTVMRICLNCNTVFKTSHISCRIFENDKNSGKLELNN